jgi:hypothetical protein
VFLWGIFLVFRGYLCCPLLSWLSFNNKTPPTFTGWWGDEHCLLTQNRYEKKQTPTLHSEGSSKVQLNNYEKKILRTAIFRPPFRLSPRLTLATSSILLSSAKWLCQALQGQCRPGAVGISATM